MSSEFAEALKRLDQYQLRVLLKAAQSRLGTAEERHDDLDDARTITHQLNNLLTSLRLLDKPEKLPPIIRSTPTK